VGRSAFDGLPHCALNHEVIELIDRRVPKDRKRIALDHAPRLSARLLPAPFAVGNEFVEEIGERAAPGVPV
jgi:ABC-type phosphonate transport system ATPase subunit